MTFVIHTIGLLVRRLTKIDTNSGQPDRQTDSQADRQTDRQTEPGDLCFIYFLEVMTHRDNMKTVSRPKDPITILP